MFDRTTPLHGDWWAAAVVLRGSICVLIGQRSFVPFGCALQQRVALGRPLAPHFRKSHRAGPLPPVGHEHASAEILVAGMISLRTIRFGQRWAQTRRQP